MDQRLHSGFEAKWHGTVPAHQVKFFHITKQGAHMQYPDLR